MSEYILLTELAQEFGLDKSFIRRYVLKNGFTPVKIRTPHSRGQLSLALPKEDAENIRELRQSQGFILPDQKNNKKQIVINVTNGFFYIIQIIPEFNPNRVKLGFASDVNARLNAHKTSAPTASLIKSWLCKRYWEQVAIDSITRIECKIIANEVFECDNIESLINRADNFFNIMPFI